MKKVYNILFYIILLCTVLFKFISIYFTPFDSDEVMWSVMVDLFLNKNAFFLFFTDQNFRGSLEYMIIFPFQYWFGINEFTLRINSIIFTFLTSLLIYKIVKEKTQSMFFSIAAFLMYFLALPGLFVIQNKAWGGYITIQFLMLACFYYIDKYLKEDEKLLKISLIGFISGISFWINEQSIYFIFILLFITFYYDVVTFISKLNKKNKLLYFVFLFLNIISIYFVILKKRMYLNLGVTFEEKLKVSINFLDFNIYFKDVLLVTFLLFILFIILNNYKKNFEFTKSRYLSYSIFTFVSFYINIYFNSFSRVYSEKDYSFSKAVYFFENIILLNFFGKLWIGFLVIIPILIFINLKIKKIFDPNNIRLENIIYLSFFLFPILFILSFLPGLTPTPRYLILWWPVTVLSIFLSISKNYFIKIFISLMFITWVTYFVLNFGGILQIFNEKIQQQEHYLNKVKLIKVSEYRYCSGGYWDVGLVMFYSKLEIKCFTLKGSGYQNYKFLDIYKPENNDKSFILNNL